MDFHGITMKGKYYAEQVSSPVASVDSSEIGRIVVNTSTTANSVADSKSQYKIFFHNGTKWLRPLVANADDAPDQDSQWDLGSSGYRWRRIYADDFYGSVRYS